MLVSKTLMLIDFIVVDPMMPSKCFSCLSQVSNHFQPNVKKVGFLTN